MTRLSQAYTRSRELIVVDASVVGPRGATEARLVVDTGAAATTRVPDLIAEIGYEERGYWLRVQDLAVLGVSTPFEVTVFSLGHRDIDGLVGMNFLRHFNFEVRPAERRILLELISPLARMG